MGNSISGRTGLDGMRYSAKKGYLPTVEDVSSLGLINEYFFQLDLPETDKITNTKYSVIRAKNPLSDEMEEYLCLALYSSEDGKDRRTPLNLVICLDISGSMRYSIDYDWNEGGGNDMTKLEICLESILHIISRMKDTERLGIVVFDHNVSVFQEIKKVSEINVNELMEKVKKISERGGTNIEGGLETSVNMLMNLQKNDRESLENKNRIIFLTDGIPNVGGGEKELISLTKKAADHKIYCTYIGVGVDFNSKLIDELTKFRGGSYFSIHENEQFEKILKDDFNYFVNPIVFDASLSFKSDAYKITKVYGTPDDKNKSGKLLEIDTMTPSQLDKRGMKGGVVLLKLEKKETLNENPSQIVEIILDYEDAYGKKFSDVSKIDLGEKMKKFSTAGFENSGTRKAFVLATYCDLLKSVISSANRERSLFKDDDVTTSYKGNSFSIPKAVKDDIIDYQKFIKEEIKILGDSQLEKELVTLKEFLDTKFKPKVQKEESDKEILKRIKNGIEAPEKFLFSKVKVDSVKYNSSKVLKKDVLKGLYHCDGKCNTKIPCNLEIAFAFDGNFIFIFIFEVTGSMSSYIEEVRKQLKSLVKTLLGDLPNIRISIIANSDYWDWKNYYVLKKIDLTNNLPTLLAFIKQCTNGAGGDVDENYEQVLLEAQTLNWSKDSKKCLVVIGDADPHRKNQYFKVNWEKEVDNLVKMGIKCYGVQCNNISKLNFYEKISKKSGGSKLVLKNMKDIIDIFMGLCYRESSDDQLSQKFNLISETKLNEKGYFIQLNEIGGIDFLRDEHILKIHNHIHNKKEAVEIKERIFDISLGTAGCRYVRIQDITFIEQNEINKNSKEKRILKGKKITWVGICGKYGFVISKR